MSDEHEIDPALVLRIAEAYKNIFSKIMHEKGMIENEQFNMGDFVYVMSHMERAYTAFDDAMELFFEHCLKQHESVDGMTAQ